MICFDVKHDPPPKTVFRRVRPVGGELLTVMVYGLPMAGDYRALAPYKGRLVEVVLNEPDSPYVKLGHRKVPVAYDYG